MTCALVGENFTGIKPPLFPPEPNEGLRLSVPASEVEARDVRLCGCDCDCDGSTCMFGEDDDNGEAVFCGGRGKAASGGGGGGPGDEARYDEITAEVGEVGDNGAAAAAAAAGGIGGSR